jgi:hypothetical protein
MLARAALEAALLGKGPLAGLFGGGLGGAGGGIVGTIGNAIGSLFGARAEGGSVDANRPYIVGEKRPELFIPAHRRHDPARCPPWRSFWRQFRDDQFTRHGERRGRQSRPCSRSCAC